MSTMCYLVGTLQALVAQGWERQNQKLTILLGRYVHAYSVTQSCLTLCSLPGSSVHGTLQARLLEWVAISFSRGSSWSRDWTSVSCVSCNAGRFFTTEPPRKLGNISREMGTLTKSEKEMLKVKNVVTEMKTALQKILTELLQGKTFIHPCP